MSTTQEQTLIANLAKIDPNAKIYVAGHRGMVGSAIVRQLEKYGFHNIITRTHRELDLTNQAQVEEFFTTEKPEYVFLAAAKVGGILANNTYRADFIYENIMIQSNVIHAAYKHQVKRLIFLGSSCIYPKNAPQPILEKYLLTSELESTNQPYAIAKISGVEMCWSYNRQYHTKFVALMPTNLYGIGDNYHPEKSHVIPALIRKAHVAKLTNSPTMEVWGTGTVLREFMTSDDMANAALFIFALPEEQLKPYLNSEEPPLFNVGTGKDCTIKEICELICDVVGFNGELKFDTSKPDGTYRKLLNVDKLASLGWKAQTDLRQGLEVSYRDFVQNHFQANEKLFQVILCGGSGSRLWPISNARTPKQFSDILATPNLFEQALTRFDQQLDDYLIVTNQSYLDSVLKSTDKLKGKRFEIMLEPQGRNTAPAIQCATKHIYEKFGDQLVLVVPSDHRIVNPEQLYKAVEEIKDYVFENKVIATFGINPDAPDTKYGYIQSGEQIDNGLFQVQKFHEKPNSEKAKEYLAQGCYYWNSGIFLFRASTFLEQMKQHAKEISKQAELTPATKVNYDGIHNNITEIVSFKSEDFAKFENISIDYALLEKSNSVVVKAVDLEWSDMGTWDAVYRYSKSDEKDNILFGTAYTHNISNSYIKSADKPIVALGVKDLVVIETDDLILVSNKSEIDQANNIVKSFALENKDKK